MPKVKLNKDSLKGFFINHVEKIVLGVVLLVFAVFVYSSLGLEGLPSNQTPDVLIQSAESARTTINDPGNAKEVLASVTVPSGYIARVDDQLTPTKAEFYTITKPPSPYFGPVGQKRLDPTLLPPEKVEVYPVSGAVAYAMTRPDEDAFAKEKNSTNVPKVDPKKEAKKKRDAEKMYGMEGGAEMSGAGMSGMPGMAGSAGMPGMSGMPGMAGMAGIPGMEGAEGMAGMTGGVMANPQDRVGFIAGQGAIAKSRNCVAVKFVVPWRKQWEEYDQKFSTALGYNPTRDTPSYISFTAERLEVTGDPNEELDWSKAKKIVMPRVLDELKTAGFYGFPQEIADPRYLFYGVLTFPVPPFINKELDPLALHSAVPKASAAATMLTEKKPDDQEKKDTKKAGDESDVPSDIPSAIPNAMAGEGSSGMPGMGMPGMPGMGMPGMAGATSGMPGMPGMGSAPGMPGMPGMGAESSMGMASGMMPGMGAEGMSSGMGMGMPGMGMEGMGMEGSGIPGMTMTRGPAVPYLLGRFYDFSVEPGKKYRYRVQVILEDPNRPKMAQLDPSDRSLDDTVKKRLNQVAEDEKSRRARIYYLRTDFSAPSEPVGIEIEPVSLAGAVSPVKTVPAPGRPDRIVVDEPQAKIMSVIWDAVKATDVAGITTALRGTYLNYTTNADAIHPVLLVYKSLENYNVQTNQLVADIRGGEPLPMAASATTKEEPLLSPGQYALVDDSGQIIVRNEFEDWDHYRRLALPELPESTTMMDTPGMGEEMMMEGMGMPGMPGTGKKKGRGRGGQSSSSSF